MGLVEHLSSGLGIDPNGLNLMIGIFLGFPVVMVYKFIFHAKRHIPSFFAHLYLTLSGVAVYYFCFGYHLIYPVVSIFSTYFVLQLFDKLHNRFMGAALNFAMTFAYFLWTVANFSTDGYDVLFTTPQAVLTLRLIGVGMDLYDGVTKKTNELHLEKIPSLLELMGFSFNVFGMLVGPQFSFADYHSYVFNKTRPSHGFTAVTSFILGFCYLGLTIVSQKYIDSAYLMTRPFLELPFYKKMFLIFVIGKVIMFKYFGVYLIQKSVSASADFHPICSFYQLGNVNVAKFETATSIHHFIESFNINTNHWAKYYIFKRLVFLKNKFLSSLITLAFLAVWHGYHMGYLICFFLELILVEAENRLKRRLSGNPIAMKPHSTVYLHPVFALIKWFLCFLVLGYALISFDLLLMWKSNIVYSSCYFVAHWIPLLIIGADILLPIKVKHQ